jgi:hypothetical protein
MTLPEKNVHLWIGSLGTMTLANIMTRLGALSYRPELAIDGRRW